MSDRWAWVAGPILLALAVCVSFGPRTRGPGPEIQTEVYVKDETLYLRVWNFSREPILVFDREIGYQLSIYKDGVVEEQNPDFHCVPVPPTSNDWREVTPGGSISFDFFVVGKYVITDFSPYDQVSIEQRPLSDLPKTPPGKAKPFVLRATMFQL